MTNLKHFSYVRIDSQALLCSIICLPDLLRTSFLLFTTRRDIIAEESYDYGFYRPESKRAVAACAAVVVSIKAVLDTPLLTENSELTEAY